MNASSVKLKNGDVLLVTVFSSVVNVTLQINGRSSVIQSDGTVELVTNISETLTTDGTRAAQSMAPVNVIASELESLEIFVTSGACVRGQVFVKCILREGGSQGNPLQVLISNYLTSNNFISFPLTPLIASTDGEGVLKSIVVSGNLGSSTHTEFVPVNSRWKILGLFIFYTSTSAVSRSVLVTYSPDGVNKIFESLSKYDQAVAEFVNYYIGDYFETSVKTQGAIFIKMPLNINFPAGGNIAALCVGGIAADSYTFSMQYEELLDV